MKVLPKTLKENFENQPKYTWMDDYEDRFKEWEENLTFDFTTKESYLEWRKQWKEIYKSVTLFRRSMKNYPVEHRAEDFLKELNIDHDLDIKFSYTERNVGRAFARFMMLYLEKGKQHARKLKEKSLEKEKLVS